MHTYIFYNIKLYYKRFYMFWCFFTTFRELWYCVCWSYKTLKLCETVDHFMIKSVLLTKCGSGCICNPNVLFCAPSYLFLSADLCHVRYNYKFFSSNIAAQRKVGGSCSKNVFSWRNAVSIFWSSCDFHIFNTFFKHNKEKY